MQKASLEKLYQAVSGYLSERGVNTEDTPSAAVHDCARYTRHTMGDACVMINEEKHAFVIGIKREGLRTGMQLRKNLDDMQERMRNAGMRPVGVNYENGMAHIVAQLPEESSASLIRFTELLQHRMAYDHTPDLLADTAATTPERLAIMHRAYTGERLNTEPPSQQWADAQVTRAGRNIAHPNLPKTPGR